MAENISRFVFDQIVRDDFLIIEDNPIVVDRECISLKQHRLHQLCLQNEYRTAEECKNIQKALHESSNNRFSENDTIELLQAYLPDCITTTAGSSTNRFNTGQPAAESLTTEEWPDSLHKNYRGSWIDADSRRYLLSLPVDVHWLMIDNSGALLAA